MSLCALFKWLSQEMWHAIMRSRRYTHPRSDGMLETSVTDFLLSRLDRCHWHDCVVYAPREIKTGADLDLILMGRHSAGQPPTGMHFRMQAKKLNRRERYTTLNRRNNNGYQADLLCNAAGFYPLYLFYNSYFSNASADRKRLYEEGCTIASAKQVRTLINPGTSGTSVLGLDALIGLQMPWWTLVCRDSGSLAARARAAAGELNARGIGLDLRSPLDGEDVGGAYHELEGPYRRLWDRRGPFPFFEGDEELQRPVVILSEPFG